MASIRLTTIFIVFASAHYCFGASLRINFERCGTKGFYCTSPKDFPGKADVLFQCSNSLADQDVTIYLWQFNSPVNITSLTVQYCKRVRISFACTTENKPIQWLKIIYVQQLDIIPATVVHNPPRIILENVSYIDTIPRHTFSQISRQSFRSNCLNPAKDLDEIYFKNVIIGTIETEAFYNLSDMKNFSWYNVSVTRTNLDAIQLTFKEDNSGYLEKCNFEVLEPMAFRVTANGFHITEGKFGDVWASAFNGTIRNFDFCNNTVGNIQTGAISILAQNVAMTENHFQTVESGAFEKISPGLLYDSKRNFGKLRFVYKFTNNVIDSVENGGVRPDLTAYRNVASDVSYAYNLMQVYMRTHSHDYLRKSNIAWN